MITIEVIHVDPFVVEDEADDAIRPMAFDRAYGDLAREKGREAERIAAEIQRRSRVEKEVRQVMYWVVPVRVSDEMQLRTRIRLTCFIDWNRIRYGEKTEVNPS